MKNNEIIFKIILTLFCMMTLMHANSIKNMPSVLIGETIGYTLSHEYFAQNKNINIQFKSVQNKLQKYLKDNGFSLKSVFIESDREIGKNLYVKGSVIHIDSSHRYIRTRFDTICTIKDKKNILLDRVELSNSAKPETLFFIVPAEKININNLKNFSFAQALKQVQSVDRKMGSSNQAIDIQPVKYQLIAFIMGKINNEDSVYSVVSDVPFSEKGKQGSLIKTKDGWPILVAEATLTYNGDIAKHFNVLWEKGNVLMALESYSTQGLVKTIQLALMKLGYDIGKLDGTLNTSTQAAIQKYIKDSKFDSSSKTSNSLLWFMQQNKQVDISKTVQIALLQNGINIGPVDGIIGKGTIRGLKKYQKSIGLKIDGKITPELVRILLNTSQNIDVYSRVRVLFNKPILMNKHQDKMWPDELR